MIAIALCEWHENWPPNADDVTQSFRDLFPQYDIQNFKCGHPYAGPEELRCQTRVNVTSKKNFENILRDIETLDARTIDIYTPNTTFHLCRMEYVPQDNKVFKAMYS